MTMTPWMELLTILTIAVLLTWAITWVAKPSLRYILLANGQVPFFLGVVSISACWLQHYAYLVSATFAAEHAVGFIVFLIFNALSMVLAGLIAPRIRKVDPRGFNTPQFVGVAFGSPRMRTMLFCAALFSSVFIISSTMISAQIWFTQELKLDAASVSIAVGVAALAFIIVTGLPGAVAGNVLKSALLLALFILGGFLSGYYAGSQPVRLATVFASTASWSDLWTYGVAIAATGLGGGVLNSDEGEHMRAIKPEDVRPAYFTVAGIFAVVVLVLGGLVGPLPKLMGFDPGNGHILLAVLGRAIEQGVVPHWILVQVAIGVTIIISTSLASMTMGAGNLVAIEVFQRLSNRWLGRDLGRSFMVGISRVVVVAILIATVWVGSRGYTPKDLFYLQVAMGPVRGAAVIPLVIAAWWGLYWWSRVPETCVFWGMLSGWVGAGAIAYGNAVWTSTFVGGKSIQLLAEHSTPLSVLWAVFAVVVFHATYRLGVSGEAKATPTQI